MALIEGASAAGKSVLCQHFTYAALIKQANVAYFTFENTTQELVDQMASIGMPVSEYLQTDRLSIFPMEEPELDEGPETMMFDLVKAMQQLPATYKLTIVDAITNFLAFQPAEVILKFCYLCKRMCRDGPTIILNQSQSGICIDTGLGSAASTGIPANAGTQGTVQNVLSWTPAYAGATKDFAHSGCAN